MTPTPDTIPASSGPRLRPSSAFTQGQVAVGPRSREAKDRLQRRTENSPIPMNSLVASAKRLTEKALKAGSFKKTTAQGWQEDAWEMWDLVGEEHFLGTTLANQASKAKFYVGRLPEGSHTIDMPEPVEDEALQGLLDSVGSGPVGFAQMIQRMLVNLWVAGDGWFVGIPKALIPDYEFETEEEAEAALAQLMAINAESANGAGPVGLDEAADITMEDLEWRMMSVSEVTLKRDGKVTLHLGESETEKVEVSPKFLYMIRVWRPHPRRWWEADSPTRSSLPVLRELVGLTMHISAQIDSRLAGAGMLILPASAARAMKLAAGIPEDSTEDPFTEALMEAMLTPIGDRSNASALVPLVVTVPDGVGQEIQHITFAKPLDTEARYLREEAIRRLALGQDAPPELLLGTGGMNHWGAWLVRDDVVSTHIEPPLALIADALTQQYLRPLMLELGYDRKIVKEFVVWYDVSDMVIRPNLASDAMSLHSVGELSGSALRRASGFDEADAPQNAKLDLATQTAFDLVKENPGLMANPGLPALVQQLKHLLAGDPQPLPKKVKDDAASAPVGPDGKPIPITNPQAQPGAPAPAQRSNPGAPPANPSIQKSPSEARPTPTAAELVEAFARVPDGNTFLAGYAVKQGIVQEVAEELRRVEGAETNPFIQGFLEEAERQGAKFSSAPGLLEDGSAPQCVFCKERAVGYVLHSEGMAFTPYCSVHEEDAVDAAETSTPDGSRDPSNVVRKGAYAGGWGAPSEVIVDDDEYVRELPGGGWALSDKAAQDVIDASFSDEYVVDDTTDQSEAFTGAIVALIPTQSSAVNGLTDHPAHMTLAYLAEDINEVALAEEEILDQVARVASGLEFSNITMMVESVGPLGDEGATVARLVPVAELDDIRSSLIDPATPVGSAHEQANKFPEFIPHVSLSYEGDDEQDLQEMVEALPEITFDRIGVWIGEQHHDFVLGADNEYAAIKAKKLGTINIRSASRSKVLGAPVYTSESNDAATEAGE